MGNLAVLPSQKGALPNDADLSRLMGAEIEYHPATREMQDYRFSLYSHGIDVLDDACPHLGLVRNRVTDNIGRPTGPQRYYGPLHCSVSPGTGGCSGRATHLRSFTMSLDNLQRVFGTVRVLTTLDRLLPLFPENAESLLQESSSDWSALTIKEIITRRAEHPIIFDRTMALIFPRIDDPSRRYWNLGTDASAGYELRTIPIAAAEMWPALERACEAITDLGGQATSACGGHIHLDMTEEDGPTVARVLTLYRMLEPLLAAPVEPNRYYERSYNSPSWRDSPEFNATSFRRIYADKYRAGEFGSRWLQASQISTHGSLEFRGLEGTLDAKIWKNYGLLLNRFIQAAKLGKPWGVKLHQVEPLVVTADSILALFKYLDLTRSDISSDLKDVRDWYIERVREFKGRDSFTRHLVNNNNLVPLKDVRSGHGRFKTQVLFSLPIETRPFSDKEMGHRVRQVLDRVLASCTPARSWVNEPLSPALYNRLRDMGHELGLLNLDEPPSYDCDEAYILRERHRHEVLIQDDKCPLLDDFCEAFFSGTPEDLGKWYHKYLRNPDTLELNAQQIENFVYIFRAWLSFWTSSRPPVPSLITAFSNGDASCVDF